MVITHAMTEQWQHKVGDVDKAVGFSAGELSWRNSLVGEQGVIFKLFLMRSYASHQNGNRMKVSLLPCPLDQNTKSQE